MDGTHVVPSPAPTRNFRKSTKFTKRGTGAGVLFSSPLHVTGGEAFEYIRRCFSPPFPANRIGFAQAGFFGCTSVSCKGFFMMTASPQGICLGRKSEICSAKAALRGVPPPLRASLTAHPASAKTCPMDRSASTEVVRVPRPTRKSTEFTKMEQGIS